MTSLEGCILGVIQGATEFLPVSSSGHLVIAKSVMGIQIDGAHWEVALHLGTLAAVMVFLWRELREIFRSLFAAAVKPGALTSENDRNNVRLACYIILAAIPAGALGLMLHERIETFFSNPLATAAFIFATGEILWLTRFHSGIPLQSALTWQKSLLIGLAQSVALLPGISRSGITISTGLLLDVNRETAAKFSFMLSIPVVLGAALLEARKLSSLPESDLFPLLLGVLAAAVTGYLALCLLMNIIKRGKLHYFSYYCWAVAVAGVAYFWTTSSAN